MFVSSRVFMELVQRQERMEAEHRLQVKRLEDRIEVLEKRPIVLGEDPAEKSTDKMQRIFEEMTNGVKDINTGRVVYTDGRD